jgi:nucleotide-binding universal stress UspA family protein
MADEGGGFIVVGVDGSEGSKAALRFALEEALARSATVEVVTGWQWNSLYEELAHVTTVEDAHEHAAAALDKTVQEALERMPATPAVIQTTRHEYAGKALMTAAEKADMLVVGTGRKGPLSRLVLGSVSEYCVRHSGVPVVVVPLSP